MQACDLHFVDPHAHFFAVALRVAVAQVVAEAHDLEAVPLVDLEPLLGSGGLVAQIETAGLLLVAVFHPNLGAVEAAAEAVDRKIVPEPAKRPDAEIWPVANV